MYFLGGPLYSQRGVPPDAESVVTFDTIYKSSQNQILGADADHRVEFRGAEEKGIRTKLKHIKKN